MALHRLTSITLGVPNVRETAEYYTDFGLLPAKDEVSSAYAGEQLVQASEYRFSTTDGGEQLRVVHSPRRRLVQLGVGADDPDDLDRIAVALGRLELAVKREGDSVCAEDPGSEVRVVVEIAPRLQQDSVPWPATNGPGRTDRIHQRADGIGRESRVHPRKLGHVVVGSTDQEASTKFFTEGLGFKVSDRVPFLAAFMRCSTDHHNVLVQQAPSATCTTPPGRSTTSTTSDGAPLPCSRRTPTGMSGGSAGTSSGRTSSGTSRTRLATSRSITAISIASWMTSSGPRACGKAPKVCTAGGRRRPRRSSPPRTSLG